VKIGTIITLLLLWALTAFAEDKAPTCETEQQQGNVAFSEATRLLAETITLKAENAQLKAHIQKLQEEKPKVGPEPKK